MKTIEINNQRFMIIPDNKITEMRQTVYQAVCKEFGEDSLEAICWLFYMCPICNNESISQILIPLANMEQIPLELIKESYELVLQKIFDADFDFLHEKHYCNVCSHQPILSLQRIIFCYNVSNIDYHNYIDYPFEQIKKFQAPLTTSVNSGTFLFFDTETTGLPKNWKASYTELNNWPRLVQIAWIIGDNDANIKEKKEFIIKPKGFDIPTEATKIHKISTFKAIQEGYDIEFVLAQFNQSIKNANYIVAHNLSFDVNIVASELFRHKIESDIFKRKQICTQKSTIDFCKIGGDYRGYKFPKLTELYQKLFQTNFNDAHNAIGDVNATFKCFYELKKRKVIKI